MPNGVNAGGPVGAGLPDRARSGTVAPANPPVAEGAGGTELAADLAVPVADDLTLDVDVRMELVHGMPFGRGCVGGDHPVSDRE
jgi:hypothetical protein